MNNTKYLLLSIKPRFAEQIFDGSKTIELRRVAPKVDFNDKVIVYVSSPVKAIWGAFSVHTIESMPPLELWDKYREEAGVTMEEFRDYFEGSETAYGIVLFNVQKFAKPIPLESLRKSHPGFHPPQLYRYLRDPDSLLQKANIAI